MCHTLVLDYHANSVRRWIDSYATEGTSVSVHNSLLPIEAALAQYLLLFRNSGKEFIPDLTVVCGLI